MEEPQKFSIMVSPSLVRELDVIKEIDHCSRASVINKALDSYITQRKRAIAAYRRKQTLQDPEAA